MDNVNSTWTAAEIASATTIAEWTFLFGTMGCVMVGLIMSDQIFERAPKALRLPGHGSRSMKGFALFFVCPAFILGMLSPIFMAYTIHNGLHVAGLRLLPQILPSTCERARHFHMFESDTSWPCAKDELVELWRTGTLGYNNLVQDGRARNIILLLFRVYVPIFLIFYIIAALPWWTSGAGCLEPNVRRLSR